MSVDFYYKGLSAEERIYPYKPRESVVLAKGTLYEAWFDTLKASPWYAQICETKEFPSQAAKETWEHFGDLRNLMFDPWWQKVGHKIFTEVIPYRPVREVDLEYAIKHNDENKPPTLVLEIPLNLSPAHLAQQFEVLVAKQFDYLAEVANGADSKKKSLKVDDADGDTIFAPSRTFNRWDHSTAKVHQRRDTKITYQQIKIWLTIFKDWTSAKEVNPKLTLTQFALQNNLSHEGKRIYNSSSTTSNKGEQMLANAASEPLKMARFLMAHATEGVFPCTDPHSWATGPSRKPRKIRD